MATNDRGLDSEYRVYPRLWSLAIILAIGLFGTLIHLIGGLLKEVIPPGWMPLINGLLFFGVLVAVIRVFSRQPVRAVALLTWKAAFRFRLFIVITVLLLAAVVGLPILIKDDGTARGFTQILLTYTLSSITGLLVSQSPREVVIRAADGIDVTVPAAEVEQLAKQPVSLMPADLAATLSADELVDVVAWMETLRSPQ